MELNQSNPSVQNPVYPHPLKVNTAENRPSKLKLPVIIGISVLVFLLIAISAAIIGCSVIGFNLLSYVLLAPLFLSLISLVALSLCIYRKQCFSPIFSKASKEIKDCYSAPFPLDLPTSWQEAVVEFDDLLSDTQWKTTFQSILNGVYVEKKHPDLPNVNVRLYYVPPGKKSFMMKEASRVFLPSTASRFMSTYHVKSWANQETMKVLKETCKMGARPANSALISISSLNLLKELKDKLKQKDLLKDTLEEIVSCIWNYGTRTSYAKVTKTLNTGQLSSALKVVSYKQSGLGFSSVVCASLPEILQKPLTDIYSNISKMFRVTILEALESLPPEKNVSKAIMISMPSLDSEYISEFKALGCDFPECSDKLVLASFFKALLSLKEELKPHRATIYFKLMINLATSLPIS